MKKVLYLSLFLLLSGCANNAKNTDEEKTTKDFIIVPGKRVGLITANTTEAALQDVYGADNLQIQSIPIGEGDTQEGVVLFPGTPNELEIIWESAASEGKPAFIRIGKDSTEWQTSEGLTIGTSLEKLEEINGKPFILYGFDWDFGGLITDWNDGNLNSNLIIALVPQKIENLEDDLTGKLELSSDNPRLRALQPIVGSIVITFDTNQNQ